MRESLRTLVFVLVAAGLAILASVVEPESATPKLMSDQGEEFYPKFRDPQAVKTIEVIDYDESTATTRPFRWSSRRAGGCWCRTTTIRWILATVW